MLSQRLQECLQTRSNITKLTVLNGNSIAFSTELHGAKIFSPADCTINKNLSIELLGYKTTATAFSKEHKLLAFANSKTIYIVNLLNKTNIGTIHTNDGEIELLAFAENSTYLIAGTKNGRVSQYRYDGKSQLSRLCSFGHTDANNKKLKNNYVSTVAFHKHYIACSGYGGTITLMKMSSLADKKTIQASKVRINALCFLDASRLLSGSVDGILRIHFLKQEGKTEQINTPFRDIKNIIKMPNPNYVLISADSNELLLVDIKNAKIASKSYLSLPSKVEHIVIDEMQTLFIALQNKQLYKFKLPHVKELREHLLHNTLDGAFDLLENDPMLQGSREHKRVEVMYEKLYSQAVEALANAQTQEAHKLTEMFRNVKSKRDEISCIFKDFKHYARFKALVESQKYALAYVMSDKFASFKRTLPYKTMEEEFRKTFTLAQKQILKNRLDLAKETLSNYLSVLTKRPIINLMLKQNRDFIEFLKAIEKRDYPLIEKLLKKNELFMQVPSYVTLKNSEQDTLQALRELINKGETKEALQQIKALQGTPQITEDLKEIYRTLKLVESLHKSYDDGDFLTAYEMIDKHYSLSELELSSLLEKHWSKLMHECEVFALKGDIKSIKEHLGELIQVKTRLAKVGDLLRVSFHSKIKGLLANRDFKNAENIIYSYIDIFGLDSEIIALMKIDERLTGEKLAITLNQERVVHRDSWVHSSLIVDS